MSRPSLIPVRKAIREASAYKEIRVLLTIVQIIGALFVGIPLIVALNNGVGGLVVAAVPILSGLAVVAFSWTAEAFLDMADAALAARANEER